MLSHQWKHVEKSFEKLFKTCFAETFLFISTSIVCVGRCYKLRSRKVSFGAQEMIYFFLGTSLPTLQNCWTLLSNSWMLWSMAENRKSFNKLCVVIAVKKYNATYQYCCKNAHRHQNTIKTHLTHRTKHLDGR